MNTLSAETQYDLWHSADSSDAQGEIVATDCLPFSTLLEQSIQRIEALFDANQVALVGASWGKDSTLVVVLCLEAALRFMARTGKTPKIVVVTADTGVENPKVIALAKLMSQRMLGWATDKGLDVTQEWVTPPVSDRYLVKIIGGQAVASVAGGSAQCAVDLKVRPMERARKVMTKTYGRDRIVTLLGTRFFESVARNKAMRGRGERFDVPYRSANGDWFLSPIADWSTGNVWEFMNNAVGGRLAIASFSDFAETLMLYELAGESTCQIGAIDPTFTQSKASCGGSRFGCWSCQKVSQDHSMDALLTSYPELEPLSRFSRTIRAGHFVPENRIQIGRELDELGQVTVGAGAYSPQWTENLLRWALSIDEAERMWSEDTGRPRRFELITDDELMMIAFMWARYGHHHPTRLFDIVAEIRLQDSPSLFPLMTDDELSRLEARSDRAAMSRRHGQLPLATLSPAPATGYLDLSVEMARFDGDALYVSGDGRGHSPIDSGDRFSVDLGDEPDLVWWWACEWAGTARAKNSEQLQGAVIDFLVRSGWITFRRGYQSSLQRYQAYSGAIAASGIRPDLADAGALASLSGFTPQYTESSAQEDWVSLTG